MCERSDCYIDDIHAHKVAKNVRKINPRPAPSPTQKKTVISLCMRDDTEHKTCLCFLRQIEAHLALIEELHKALQSMVEQFGFHRVHNGLVNDERQAILNAQDALAKSRAALEGK